MALAARGLRFPSTPVPSTASTTIWALATSAFTSLITEMARDASAFQRAMIDFLKEKDIICSDEDMKHLQRLHLRHVARIDQEIAEKKDELKERDLDGLGLI